MIRTLTRSRRLLTVALTCGAMLAWTAGTADAGNDGMQPISGLSPFPPGCGPNPEEVGLAHRALDSEVEPTVAVNPVNRRNIVVAWMQDYTQGLVVAATKDGGRTWRQVVVDDTSTCSGGDYELAADPWLAFGPDGRAYLSGFSLDVPDVGRPIPFQTRWEVRTSDDGGVTWSQPAQLAPGVLQAYDRPSVVADPRIPGLVYAVGVHCLLPPCVTTGVAVLRSEDGGRSWSLPRVVHVSDRNIDMVQMEVLPDGSLVVFSGVEHDGEQPYQILASRSEDRGHGWSAPIEVARFSGTGEGRPCCPFFDPETGTPVMAQENNFTTAVSPGGNLYVTYRHVPDPDREGSVIRVSRSRDGGRSWQHADVRALETQMFLPALAVAGDGTLGIAYYDLRHDVLGDAIYSTDLWFLASRDGGRTWSERHLAGPFDLRTAMHRLEPINGLFVGDYHGIDASGRRFAVASALARPLAAAGPSDIFFAALRASP